MLEAVVLFVPLLISGWSLYKTIKSNKKLIEIYIRLQKASIQ